jgi:hypothetical protein
MSYFFMIFGSVIICYTVVAYYLGFPQLSDFLPVGFLEGKSGEQFYKVEPLDKPDKGPWLVIGLGAALILFGLYIKYVLHR